MKSAEMHQLCATLDVRELAQKIGLTVPPDAWVVVEVDEDGRTVDVMIRKWIRPPV